MPRRVMRQCLLRAYRYPLGRQSNAKASWLRVLSKHVFFLKIGEGFETFRDHLFGLTKEAGRPSPLFEFQNDATPYARITRKRTLYHEPGKPMIKVVYRGPRSRKLYLHLRKNFNRCTSVYCHDRYYGSRYLCHKGVQRVPVSERRAKLLAR